MTHMIPLNQRVKVFLSAKGTDEWGVPIKSPSATTYRVRLDFNSQSDVVYSGAEGKEIVYKATIYFKGMLTIGYSDFIEFDSGLGGFIKSNPKIISPITDLRGEVLYTKVVV